MNAEQQVLKALQELVAVKDLKVKYEAMNPMARGAPGRERAALRGDYLLRKGPAWDAARDALALMAAAERVAAVSHADDELTWAPAPSNTKWGDGMVEAVIAIDRDHTLSLFCEAEMAEQAQLALQRMFNEGKPT